MDRFFSSPRLAKEGERESGPMKPFTVLPLILLNSGLLSKLTRFSIALDLIEDLDVSLPLPLHEYLHQVLGREPEGDLVGAGALRGLPGYLANRYRCHAGKVLGLEVIFAQVDRSAAQSPTRTVQDVATLARHFGKPVVVVFEGLAAWERRRYLEAGVPFIVPGNQMFLPMLFTDLRERFLPKPTSTDAAAPLSWASQVVLLRHLLAADVEGSSLTELAERLGYSAMTITNASRELGARALCEVSKAGRTREFRFPRGNRRLWHSAAPFLRSPMRATHRLSKCDVALPSAGLDALAARTDIAPESVRSYAASAADVVGFLGRSVIEKTSDPDATVAMLEVWNYNPLTLSDSPQIVDPLSLYLSLKDDPDERVMAAVEEMLEALPWS